ncbi:hypothetical protein [Actinomadura sp. GTD37]|uniref:hypothetical protein n=1 Tax=Actinomadura sp. GTD37 TaxID=1778030 RepID=UPI0035C1E703
MAGRVPRSRAEQLAGYRRVLEARDLATSPDRLRVLADDEVGPVRVWAGLSPRTPPDALERLAHDEDDYVRRIAMLHPNTPEAALRHMAALETVRAGDRYFLDRETIAHHPNVSRALRNALVGEGTCRDRRECRESKSMWRNRSLKLQRRLSGGAGSR